MDMDSALSWLLRQGTSTSSLYIRLRLPTPRTRHESFLPSITVSIREGISIYLNYLSHIQFSIVTQVMDLWRHAYSCRSCTVSPLPDHTGVADVQTETKARRND